MKKSADKLAIAYVIILSLIPVLALPNLIFQSHVLDAIPYDASALTTELGFFSVKPACYYLHYVALYSWNPKYLEIFFFL